MAYLRMIIGLTTFVFEFRGSMYFTLALALIGYARLIL